MFLPPVAYLRPDIVALVLTLKTTGVRQRHGWCLPPARMVADTGTSAGGRAHSGHDGHMTRGMAVLCANVYRSAMMFFPDPVFVQIPCLWMSDSGGPSSVRENNASESGSSPAIVGFLFRRIVRCSPSREREILPAKRKETIGIY